MEARVYLAVRASTLAPRWNMEKNLSCARRMEGSFPHEPSDPGWTPLLALRSLGVAGSLTVSGVDGIDRMGRRAGVRTENGRRKQEKRDRISRRGPSTPLRAGAEVAERDRRVYHAQGVGCGHLIGPRGLGPNQMPATVGPEEVGNGGVNAALKKLFFSRFENDRLLRILPAEPQNRRISNRRMSKESEPSRIPPFDIRCS